MASPSTVVTRGYGPFGTASLVVTRGYGIGVPPVTLPTTGAVVRCKSRNQLVNSKDRR